MFIVCIACMYAPSDASAEMAEIIQKFCTLSVPWLQAAADVVIYAGHMPDHLWEDLDAHSELHWNKDCNSLSIKFPANEGKSTYINTAIEVAESRFCPSGDAIIQNEVYIATIDCDMTPTLHRFRPWSLVSLAAILQARPDIGIIAPNQVPFAANRHLATVYEKCYKVNDSPLHVHWSTKHHSIAGGMWMFPKTTVYDRVQFSRVGAYGPEDTIFAKYVHQNLKLKCCLVHEYEIEHNDAGKRRRQNHSCSSRDNMV